VSRRRFVHRGCRSLGAPGAAGKVGPVARDAAFVADSHPVQQPGEAVGGRAGVPSDAQEPTRRVERPVRGTTRPVLWMARTARM
jgi:hypothetical protein